METLNSQQKAELNQQALGCAREYRYAIAWPTVVLGLVAFTGYWALLFLVMFKQLSLLLAVPLMAMLIYAAYTVLHEAVHYCISGNIKSLRWLNDGMGYLAATILLTGLVAHRHEHLKHHRNANNGNRDPDQYAAHVVSSVGSMLRSCWTAIAGQYTTYMADRWDQAPARQNIVLMLEIAMAIGLRALPFALLSAFGDASIQGRWVEGLIALVASGLAGTFILVYLFAYIVHRPHTVAERYLNTSIILIPGPLSHLTTVLWGYQNYHAVHHLFPWVPFYQYRRLFNRIRPVMNAMGAPIYQLSWRGLRPVSPQNQ
jgi:beta-carotene hydroxylase